MSPNRAEPPTLIASLIPYLGLLGGSLGLLVVGTASSWIFIIRHPFLRLSFEFSLRRMQNEVFLDAIQWKEDFANVCFNAQIIVINFRKEILPFIPKTEASKVPDDTPDDCSDVLIVADDMAIAAHNEDANVALVGHTYLIQANLGDGQSFTAYTYAGELPSCAFGFNSHGLVICSAKYALKAYRFF